MKNSNDVTHCDINIAFMNEIAIICDKLKIDTAEVLDGMNTKWNALGFKPGLVGGHCIGVDPYYLTNISEKLGYHSQIILNGRQVNDSMGAFVADAAIKEMIEHQQDKYSWTFIFLGANMDAVGEAASLGIDASHSHTYTASAQGTSSVYTSLNCAMSCLRNIDYDTVDTACVDSLVAKSLSSVE